MMIARIATFARNYLAALGARRHIMRLGAMTDECALEFARSFCWRGGHIQPGQSNEEILWLLERVRALQPRVVVEIGADEGGTLFLWTRASADNARLVAVDTRPLGRLGRLSSYAVVRRGFARDDQRVDLLFPRDSHDPRTVEELTRLIAAAPIDFLFIDGDHSYEGVKQDYELYAPLVRDGGIVALHDVGAADAPGVTQFWSELAETSRSEELVASGYGIGVVHVGAAARTTA
jgi:predicted O-methyltransferase YrrM